ncbi:hypothetical protein, partial [Burkholderia pseudomallei]|uniref:hypothetical protein n=1 Tax=Burkholderia pseudomallei TaxID=28450 RepID=UPI001C3DE70A
MDSFRHGERCFLVWPGMGVRAEVSIAASRDAIGSNSGVIARQLEGLKIGTKSDRESVPAACARWAYRRTARRGERVQNGMRAASPAMKNRFPNGPGASSVARTHGPACAAKRVRCR